MIYFISKSECRMCTRAHIGTQKKGGNILILPRCVGTTPTHLYRPIGIDNDPIVHGIVATSSRVRRFVGRANFRTIFVLGTSPCRQEEPFLMLRRLSNLLHNVGALPSYVHHIL